VDGLEWLGLIGLSDPVRAGAGEAIAAFHRAGVRTIILTGDQAPTARKLAADLGLATDGSLDVVDAVDMRGRTPREIAEMARTAEVFSRVSPTDKLAIVQALQANGHVVAMTGDGVNDGPALRAADVGVAMGASGNDVARDAADIVIADDDIASLARALARGRGAEENLRRAVRFLLATNASEVALLLTEGLQGPDSLETPGELFWLNLVTDVFPAIGVAMAPPAADILDRRPRAQDAGVFSATEARRIAADALGIAFPAALSHFFAAAVHGPGPQARGLTFLTLASRQLAHALALRPRTDRGGSRDFLSRRPIEMGVALSFALLAAPFLVPPLRTLLRIAQPKALEATLALGFSLLPILQEEIREWRSSRAANA
jgi:Ca2+-transporting ATPase